jgi:hypothetical protein
MGQMPEALALLKKSSVTGASPDLKSLRLVTIPYSFFIYHWQGPPSSTTFGFIDVPGYITQVLSQGFPSANTQVGQYL